MTPDYETVGRAGASPYEWEGPWAGTLMAAEIQRARSEEARFKALLMAAEPAVAIARKASAAVGEARSLVSGKCLDDNNRWAHLSQCLSDAQELLDPLVAALEQMHYEAEVSPEDEDEAQAQGEGGGKETV